MSDLKRLTELCKASVYIEVNKHKDYYQTVAEYLEERDIEGAEPEVIAKMIDLDSVVELQFYPRTPIGFHLIWHYDVDLALGQAVEYSNRRPKNHPSSLSQHSACSFPDQPPKQWLYRSYRF